LFGIDKKIISIHINKDNNILLIEKIRRIISIEKKKHNPFFFKGAEEGRG